MLFKNAKIVRFHLRETCHGGHPTSPGEKTTSAGKLAQGARTRSRKRNDGGCCSNGEKIETMRVVPTELSYTCQGDAPRVLSEELELVDLRDVDKHPRTKRGIITRSLAGLERDRASSARGSARFLERVTAGKTGIMPARMEFRVRPAASSPPFN